MSDPLPQMTPMSALGGTTPKTATHGPVTLTEVTQLALASVSARLGQAEACRMVLQELLRQPAPRVEGLVMHDPETAFWMGPDQWMISAPHETHEDLAAQLKHRCGASASVTEQNDAWVVLDMKGDVVPVMELLCPINMRVFDQGNARRTTIDHLGCFVTHPGIDHLRIFGPRSSAGSLYHALLTAMRSAH